MKFVTAIIKPFLLDDVRDALIQIGVTGLIIDEVKGFGRQRGHVELFRGQEYTVTLIPKLRLDIAVADDLVEKTIKVICDSARTGRVGDGKIFVTPIEQVVRIRTGERDHSAL